MKITRLQLKEIIREELNLLKESTIKTKDGLEVELTRKGKYELLRLWMHKRKGYVEFHGRPDITNFLKVLIKNLRIV
jgi:hypothetical protein